MKQTPSDQEMQNTGNQKKTCDICNQTFNSDRELQVHKQTAHSQSKQSAGQTGPDRTSKDPGKDYSDQNEQKRDKIA